MVYRFAARCNVTEGHMYINQAYEKGSRVAALSPRTFRRKTKRRSRSLPASPLVL